MTRVHRLKFILWMVAGLAAAVAAARFLFGLGATTHLSDATPWGIWIGFDVMGGVALAAGGFIMTAAVYIFRLERFHDSGAPGGAHGFPRLCRRGGRAALRSGPALEHLAHDRLLEPAFAVVRGWMVRDAVPGGADAGILPGAGRGVQRAGQGPAGSCSSSACRWSFWASGFRRCTSRRSGRCS